MMYRETLARRGLPPDFLKCYPMGSTIYVGCFSQLSISHFGSRFTKKSYFGTLKMEKALFVGRNENRPLWRSFTSQGTRTCPIWLRSDKLLHMK
jgi:hypothetical protein